MVKNKSEEFKTLSVARDVAEVLESMRKKEEARTGMHLSWTQFFRAHLRQIGRK